MDFEIKWGRVEFEKFPKNRDFGQNLQLEICKLNTTKFRSPQKSLVLGIPTLNAP